MTKFIKTILSPDGSKVTWKMHDAFDSRVILDECDPGEEGATAARSRHEKEIVSAPERLQPEEKKFIDKVGDYFNELQKEVARITGVVVKYADMIGREDAEGKSKLRRLEASIHDLRYDAEIKLKDCHAGYMDQLRSLAGDRKDKVENLRHFKHYHHLEHRDAEYPDSWILQVGIIASLLVVEAVVNASFYADASELGLFGGALSGFLIAAANVLVSFAIGMLGFRYRQHRDLLKRMLAWIGIFAGFYLLALLHLGAAHFRELLKVDVDMAKFEVIPRTISDPFGINDLESFVLILIGTVVSLWVMSKGYHFDE